MAASQCCGGSERVWRGGAAQGTSQYHRPAASSQQATALPIVSSLARRTEMPPLWRSSLQRAAKEKVLRPTRARLWASTSRQRTERWGQPAGSSSGHSALRARCCLLFCSVRTNSSRSGSLAYVHEMQPLFLSFFFARPSKETLVYIISKQLVLPSDYMGPNN